MVRTPPAKSEAAVVRTPPAKSQDAVAIQKPDQAVLHQQRASVALSKLSKAAQIFFETAVPIFLITALFVANLWLLKYNNWNVDVASVQGKFHTSKTADLA